MLTLYLNWIGSFAFGLHEISFGSEPLADMHLQVRLGGDAALMHGLMKIQLENDSLDYDFIKNSTNGFEDVVNRIAKTSWERIVEDSGLNQDDIEKAGQMLSDSKATIACWAMGLTQHRNGVAVIQEVTNLLSWVATLERKVLDFARLEAIPMYREIEQSEFGSVHQKNSSRNSTKHVEL